jgi:lipopolysaccharide transport system ATP-binding protein
MNEFWALKEVSFSLYPGEVVAILGHNGSGKSTLLKLMSRIIEPTHGKIFLTGRLGALLEIGTGMHPELTGLENIYFCGALLGMKKKEINRHLDEIISFAEIEAFLQTPFKKYSSGMSLRLAASILLHLKTDVLILDEILSVGDYAFQNLCFNKIKEVASDGRLVLCVTHHEEWISTYCKRALLLNSGKLIADGSPLDILHQYHTQPLHQV